MSDSPLIPRRIQQGGLIQQRVQKGDIIESHETWIMEGLGVWEAYDYEEGMAFIDRVRKKKSAGCYAMIMSAKLARRMNPGLHDSPDYPFATYVWVKSLNPSPEFADSVEETWSVSKTVHKAMVACEAEARLATFQMRTKSNFL